MNIGNRNKSGEGEKIRQSSQGQERSVCQRRSAEARSVASVRDAVLKPGTQC